MLQLLYTNNTQEEKILFCMMALANVYSEAEKDVVYYLYAVTEVDNWVSSWSEGGGGGDGATQLEKILQTLSKIFKNNK